jgi:broad specificity phosphatase PhoE
VNPFNSATIKVLILTLIIQVLSSDVLAQSDDAFTIYLVRHSEKDHTSENSSDLPLSECGEQRSKALSHFLSEVDLDAVYSTDFRRTINTAMPTADKKDIEITLYNEEDVKSFSNLLLDNKQDALVVGHSNTTGVLAGLLVNNDVEDIELHIYDRIYQVVVCGDSRTLNLFHSNFECVK